MSSKSQLTTTERRELKEIWMDLWSRKGEAFNRATNEPEVADLWYEAVLTYLARKNRFNDSNNTAENTND